jgi:histone deacetylase 6
MVWGRMLWGIMCGEAAGDELGECSVTPAGYSHLTDRLLQLAGGRLVLALEG